MLRQNYPVLVLGAAVALLASCSSSSKSGSSTSSSTTPAGASSPESNNATQQPSAAPSSGTTEPLSTSQSTSTGTAASTAQQTLLTAAQLAGSWVQSSCSPVSSSTSSKDTVQFTGENYSDTRQYYADTACTTAVTQAEGGVLALTGTFNIVGSSSLPSADNPQNAPAGTNFLALNITNISANYGSGTTATAAAAAYQKEGCAGASASGSVVNLTPCFASSAGSGTTTYQFVLPNAAITALSIGDLATITSGCSQTAGAAKGVCTTAQLAVLAAAFQKQ